ncbi:MAG: hypothetical protein IPK66_11870 [Rhodospirillales bacterium]|nr:hypothetical protein [Rhodospirillales bacterium]
MKRARFPWLCRLAVLAAAVLTGCTGDKGADREVSLTTSPASPTAALMVPPMPPGDWQSIYEGDQNLLGGVSHRRILVSENHGVIDRLVLVYRVELGMRYDFKPRTSCSRPEYYYAVNSSAANTGSGACWHIREINLGLGGHPHWINVVLAHYAAGRDEYLPVVMVGARFIRFHDGQLWQVDYGWNPDLLLPPPENTVWQPADWTNEAVASDPAKQVVMETLRHWAEDWEPQIAEQFPF